MLSRILIAVALAAAVVSGGAVAFLRTDFVANNLCSYAVATIEEATLAKVKVAQCSVQPEQGKLTIEGLQVGDPGGRLDLRVARVFAQVTVRPILQRVRLIRLEIDHPELHLRLDQQAPSPAASAECLPDLLDRFEFGRVKVRKASVEVRAPGLRVAVPRAAVSVKGKGAQLAVEVATRGGAVELPGRMVGLISTRTAALVDLRGSGAVEVQRADLIGNDASAFLKGSLRNLCNPRIEAAANVRIDDLETATARFASGLLEGVRGSLSADATVSVNNGAAKIKGDLRVKGLALEGLSPGDARLRFDLTPARVRVERLELPVGRGQVSGAVEVGFGSGVPFAADVQMRDMEFAELLRKLGVPRSIVMFRASGRAQMKGTLSPLALAGDTAVDVADFAVLDRPYEQRARAQKMFEFAAAKVSAAVAVDRQKVVVRNAAVQAGDSHIDAESTFFTDVQKGLQLLAHGEGVDLDDFRGHIAAFPAHGRVTFAARIAGPYSALRIESSTSARDFRFFDLSLGDVSTELELAADSMRLSLADIEGHKGRSWYRGRLALDLRDPAAPLQAHLELPDAHLHDLVELGVGLVPALEALRDAGDVDGHVAAVIDAEGPAAGPDATVKLALDSVSLFGQSFERGTARLALYGQEPRLQIEELSLGRGEARLAVSGRFGPAWQLDIDGRTENFTLDDVDLLKPARLSGPISATVHVGGVAQVPLIGAQVKFDEAMVGTAQLGAGSLALAVEGKALTLRAKVGAHRLQAQAQLSGDFPYSCSASLRATDLEEYIDVFAPDAEIQSGSLAAEMELKGSLLDLGDSSGSVTISQLKVVHGDMPLENDGPAQLSIASGAVQIQRLALRAPYTTAQLVGSRARDGKLDLRLSASVDGKVLQSLMADVEHASGTYLVQASVGGTSQDPLVLGNVRIEDAAVSLRGLPVAARALNGSISFSQDALVIDSLQGKLNNGEARVSGGVEMKRLSPQKVDVAAHISDVNVKTQENVGATLDGDLTLLGPPLEPVLGGSLIVSRLVYTEDIDVERSLLDFSRRPPSPRVLTKSAVLVHFDLDVHLGRGVRVENNLARTDLKGDLKVTGTSRALGLLGSINTVHGAANFRGNEFQIEQGVLSFTDRQRIRPSFDFQARTQIKSGNDEYKVNLHAFGTPSDSHVVLSSDPALAEGDLGFLLTFGFVSHNLQQSTFSAADSGLAIGIEALNKATGFSEEVRRFIPKNAILRDPAIDFASDFSVATNRLEPMARFQSHLITERLDLKVLEGLTTRRYRGVVSYQLSDALSTRLQLDNEHVTSGTGTDFGIDLHLKWEGE